MTENQDLKTDVHADVIVIGGGAAGLAGATTIARTGRSVLVIDAGEPRNAPAQGVHSFLSREGTPPRELLAIGRDELTSYGGRIVAGLATTARQTTGGFEVDLADGTTYAARRLLVTTGVTDDLPDLPGLREHWGTSVVHCPFCHGHELRGQRLAVLATGPLSVSHQALLWSQWTDDLTLLLHEQPEPDSETARRLAARGVRVVHGRVDRVLSEAGRLVGVEVAGERVACTGLAVATFVRPRSAVLEALGVEVADLDMGGSIVGQYVPGQVGTGLTSVPGVYVAGNVASPMAQVITSAAAGVASAGAITMDLVLADIG